MLAFNYVVCVGLIRASSRPSAKARLALAGLTQIGVRSSWRFYWLEISDRQVDRLQSFARIGGVNAQNATARKAGSEAGQSASAVMVVMVRSTDRRVVGGGRGGTAHGSLIASLQSRSQGFEFLRQLCALQARDIRRRTAKSLNRLLGTAQIARLESLREFLKRRALLLAHLLQAGELVKRTAGNYRGY